MELRNSKLPYGVCKFALGVLNISNPLCFGAGRLCQICWNHTQSEDGNGCLCSKGSSIYYDINAGLYPIHILFYLSARK